ncbi:MAG TPA: sugar phosphate isomerase/epimerase [Gemmatimonadales bacterium]
MDRRAFVQWCASGLAASRLPLPPRIDKLPAIGLQLYTVRSLLQQDFEGTIARVAQIGYREVEFAGTFGRTARDVRALLDRHGLRAPATHVSKDALERESQRILDDSATIGHRFVCVAWVPQEERRTLDDWKRIAAAFNGIGERCRAAGFQFAYHNHDFEFEPLEGRIPYDVLLAETDRQLVQLELDLYWITKGGADPFAYFAREPGRFPLVHVKDSAGPPEHRMVDVGSGTIDFRRIFAQRQAGIRHFFVEHDQPADPLASIRASFEHLKQLEF